MSSARNKELAGLFIFSAALLSLELSFTKFFSVVLWYHFGFLIISTAMLGFSVSGVFLAFSQRTRHVSFQALILVSSIVTALCYVFLTRINFTPISAVQNFSRIYLLIIIIILLFIPFFFLGLTIGKILTERKDSIHLYYGINLAGSAFGAPLYIIIFDHFNGQIGILIDILLMAVAGIIVWRKKSLTIVSTGCAALFFILAFFPSLFPMEPPEDKILGLIKDRKNAVVATGWSSLSKVDFIKNPDPNIYPAIGIWGISKQYFYDLHLPLPDRLGIIIDSWAYTSVMKYPQDLRFYDYMPTTFAYQLGRTFESSLHIGAGGGLDLIAAKHYGVGNITGVEINPVIVSTIQEKFDNYSGGIYTGKIPGISIVTDEGRHFVEGTSDLYDLIQLSGVDTYSSTQAGAFALSENNLYTVEALLSYYARLNDNGIVTMTRWYTPDDFNLPRTDLRLLNIVKEAFMALDIDPKDRIFYFYTPDNYTVLTVKKGVFSPQEIENGKNFILKNGFTPLVIPGQDIPNIHSSFLDADPSSYRQKLAEYPYLVDAPTDDKPFFFEMRRFLTLFTGLNSMVLPLSVFSGQSLLFIILFELIVLGVFLILIPLIIFKKKEGVKLPFPQIIYFAAIGLGFMFVEIVLSQKLVLYLGHPSYALSVVLLSVLLFSGFGSIVSGRWKISPMFSLGLLSLLLLATVFLLTPMITATLNTSFFMRVVLCLGFIAPLSFLMGTAFPAGAKIATREALPFLWGINGFFSVVASVVTLMVSINTGFTTVFVIAVICYMTAFLQLFFSKENSV